MLVLSRKEGESIVIQGRIVVSVLNVRGHRVRLGIQAPHDIVVHRREVLEAIMSEETGERRIAEDSILQKT